VHAPSNIVKAFLLRPLGVREVAFPSFRSVLLLNGIVSPPVSVSDGRKFPPSFFFGRGAFFEISSSLRERRGLLRRRGDRVFFSRTPASPFAAKWGVFFFFLASGTGFAFPSLFLLLTPNETPFPVSGVLD